MFATDEASARAPRARFRAEPPATTRLLLADDGGPRPAPAVGGAGARPLAAMAYLRSRHLGLPPPRALQVVRRPFPAHLRTQFRLPGLPLPGPAHVPGFPRDHDHPARPRPRHWRAPLGGLAFVARVVHGLAPARLGRRRARPGRGVVFPAFGQRAALRDAAPPGEPSSRSSPRCSSAWRWRSCGRGSARCAGPAARRPWRVRACSRRRSLTRSNPASASRWESAALPILWALVVPWRQDARPRLRLLGASVVAGLAALVLLVLPEKELAQHGPRARSLFLPETLLTIHAPMIRDADVDRDLAKPTPPCRFPPSGSPTPCTAASTTRSASPPKPGTDARGRRSGFNPDFLMYNADSTCKWLYDTRTPEQIITFCLLLL